MKRITTQKPWGCFEQFTLNEVSTVKILHVNKGESISQQFHEKRMEFWRIISGHPVVTIGDKVLNTKPNEEFIIKEREIHRLEAPNDEVEVLEISFGDFDEKDITRMKDIYGRE